jgi:hypothetical protein
MPLALSLERAPHIELYGQDRNVTSLRIRAYEAILYVGIVSVGHQLNQ